MVSVCVVDEAQARVSATPDVTLIPSSRIPRWVKGPAVSMVRNTEPLTRPFAGNPPQEAVKNVARLATLIRGAIRSSRIIAVSDWTKELLDRYPFFPMDRVIVVPHGVRPLPIGSAPSALTGGEEGYVLTAGSIRPARGLKLLLEAYSELPRESRPKLAIAGSVDPGMQAHHEELRRVQHKHGLDGDVVWLGGISEGEMGWAMAMCRAFVVSSEAEACPNLLLEALAQGALIVSTDQRPMPDFARSSATYFHCGSPSSLTSALQSVLTGANGREKQMREGALREASRFTWQSCAEGTVEALWAALRC